MSNYCSIANRDVTQLFKRNERTVIAEARMNWFYVP